MRVDQAWSCGRDAHISVCCIRRGVASISVDETVSGWMLGIGAEYALWDNWTAKIEYNRMDFGSSGPFADDKFNILKAGINYRFGGSGWRF